MPRPRLDHRLAGGRPLRRQASRPCRANLSFVLPSGGKGSPRPSSYVVLARVTDGVMGACERTEELDRVVLHVARRLVAVHAAIHIKQRDVCIMDRDKGQRISKTAWTLALFIAGSGVFT
jgi:hypothetical protein